MLADLIDFKSFLCGLVNLAGSLHIPELLHLLLGSSQRVEIRAASCLVVVVFVDGSRRGPPCVLILRKGWRRRHVSLGEQPLSGLVDPSHWGLELLLSLLLLRLLLLHYSRRSL